MLHACAGAVLMHGMACGRPSAWVAKLTGVVYLFSLVTKHDPGAVPVSSDTPVILGPSSPWSANRDCSTG